MSSRRARCWSPGAPETTRGEFPLRRTRCAIDGVRSHKCQPLREEVEHADRRLVGCDVIFFPQPGIVAPARSRRQFRAGSSSAPKGDRHARAATTLDRCWSPSSGQTSSRRFRSPRAQRTPHGSSSSTHPIGGDRSDISPRMPVQLRATLDSTLQTTSPIPPISDPSPPESHDSTGLASFVTPHPPKMSSQAPWWRRRRRALHPP